VAQACPVEYDEQGFSQTPPVQLPVDAGDEAVVWRTPVRQAEVRHRT